MQPDIPTPKSTDENPSAVSGEEAPNFSDIVTPEGVGIKIDDVNKTVWHYIWQHKRLEVILVTPLIALWELFIIWILIIYMSSSNHSSNSGRGFDYLIAGPIVLASGWFWKIKKQFEDAFLEEFARVNNYTFQKDGTVDETYGTIFRLLGTHFVSDIVTGIYNGNQMRLFLHDWYVDKNKYHNTVLEIDLNGQLPNLLLVPKNEWAGLGALVKKFGIKDTFSLEGDFNQKFTLYGSMDNRIQALEVFAPDTMALMEDEARQFSVEFAGNRIYIYSNDYIGKSQDLTSAFALAKKLIEKIGPIAFRLKSDEDMVATPVNVLQTRQTNMLLQKSTSIYLASMIVLVTITVVFGVIAIIEAPRSSNNITSTNPTPRVSPLFDTNEASVLGYQWLWNLQQGNFVVAYQMEDANLQKLQNLSTQSHTLGQLFPKNYIATNIEERAGLRASGQQVVSVVYRVTFPGNQTVAPFYVEIYVQNVGGWKIDNYRQSAHFINADTPL